MNHKGKKGGFMLMEIVIAGSILAAFVLTALGAAQKSINLSSTMLHQTEASFLLEEGAEAVRVARDSNWTNVSGLTAGTNYYTNFSTGTWTLSTTPSTIGIFTRTITVASVNRSPSTQDIAAAGSNDPDTKLITVTVSWNEKGTTITRTISFYIMNIF